MSLYLQSIEHARSASLVDLGTNVRNLEYQTGGTFAAYDPVTRTVYNLRPGTNESGQWRPTVYVMKRVLSIASQSFNIDNVWNSQYSWNQTISGLAIIGRKLIAYAGGSSQHVYYRVFSILSNGELAPIGETKVLEGIIPNTNRTSQKNKTIVRGSSIFHLTGMYNGTYYRVAVYKLDFIDMYDEVRLNIAKWLVNGNTNQNYGAITGSIGTEYYSTTQHKYGIMDMTYDVSEGCFIALHGTNGDVRKMQFVKFDEDLKHITSNYVDTGYNNGNISYYRHGISCPPGSDRIYFYRENNAAAQEFLIFSVKKSDFSDLRNHHYYDTHLQGGTTSNWYEAYGRSMAYIGNKLYMVYKDANWRNSMEGFDVFKYPFFRTWVATEKADPTYMQRDYSSSTSSDFKGYGTSDNESYIEQLENNSDYFGEYSIGIGMTQSSTNKVFWFAWKNDFIGTNYPIGYHSAFLDVDTTNFDKIHQIELVVAEQKSERRDRMQFNKEIKSLSDQVITDNKLTLLGGQVNDLYKGV